MNAKQRKAKKKHIQWQVEDELRKTVHHQGIVDGLIEFAKDNAKLAHRNSALRADIRELQAMIRSASKAMSNDHQLLLVAYVPAKYHKLFRETMVNFDEE